MNNCVFPSNGTHAFSELTTSLQSDTAHSNVQHGQRRTIGQISGGVVGHLANESNSAVYSEPINQTLHDLDTDDDEEEAPKPKYGKKTRGRVKVKMQFITNKLRRYTTFSKRKTGIMKKVGGACVAKDGTVMCSACRNSLSFFRFRLSLISCEITFILP